MMEFSEEINQQIIDLQNQINSLKAQNSNTFSNTIIQTKETLLQSGGIQSNNYVAGTSGWRLSADGKISGNTPLAGTKVYYVSDTSGGTVNRKLTFINGVLISET